MRSTRAGPHYYPIAFTAGCKVMVDAAARLLSLINQMASVARPVTLEFHDGEEGVMGYLSRIGFFELLHSSVAIAPNPPSYSRGEVYRGTNGCIVST